MRLRRSGSTDVKVYRKPDFLYSTVDSECWEREAYARVLSTFLAEIISS